MALPPVRQPGSQPASHPKWPLPSQRVRELLRRGAEVALNAPAAWLNEIDEASLSAGSMRFVAEDPVLMAALRRVNRGSLIHWAAANMERPGAPVAPYTSPDVLANARELVRRGAADLVFNSSRAAQSRAWQLWMNIAFELTSDPADLRELLTVSAQSIAAFVDGTMIKIADFMKAEREELMRGTHVDRRDLVTRIMEGAISQSRQASQRLGYNLDPSHHAAVIWSEEPDTELSQLEAASQVFASNVASMESLVVIANAATLWVWTHGHHAVNVGKLRSAIQGLAGVRMAVGSADKGIEGFRRAHLDALSAQHLLGRLHAGTRFVHFEMVRLVSLMTRDTEAMQQFVTHTLGELATAEPVLRRTLLTFLSAGCNATDAALLLHTHRNTLLRRLARAQELLPRPLEHNRVHVAAALEALSWTAEEIK